ncbi:MAG: hypothetical protein EXR99_11950 [Gemmataceae bacterium]|nr:hypothetical protein [Gemmataceae bacterium]
MNPNASDQLLVESCLEGSQGAWNRLVDQVIGVVHFAVMETGWSLGLKPQPEEVEKILSEIFTELLRLDGAALREYQGQSKLSTYLAMLARKIAWSEWKKKGAVLHGGEMGAALAGEVDIRETGA